MALITCHECKQQVSTTAKTCPSCGAKVKKPAGILGMVFVGVLGLGVVMAIVGSQSSAPPPPPEKTPEQIAAAKKRDAQLQAAGAAALVLKRAMKDPESFELKSLVVMPNGTACFEYRGKNSFGAVLPSEAVLTAAGKMMTKDKQGNAFVKVWNAECTVSGGDEIAPLVKRLGII